MYIVLNSNLCIFILLIRASGSTQHLVRRKDCDCTLVIYGVDMCIPDLGVSECKLPKVKKYHIMQIIRGGKLSWFSWISSKFFLSYYKVLRTAVQSQKFYANNKKTMQLRNFSTVNDLHYMVCEVNSWTIIFELPDSMETNSMSC